MVTPFALWFFYHYFSASPKPMPPSHLPPTNYSFKVVLRVFRDFHSVPERRCAATHVSAAAPLTTATYSTTTLPVIFGLIEQKYGYVPALLNV